MLKLRLQNKLKNYFGTCMIALSLYACTGNDNQTNKVDVSENLAKDTITAMVSIPKIFTGTFKDFLDYFVEVKNLKKWTVETQNLLVKEGDDLLSKGEQILATDFKKINNNCYSFINIKKLRNVDPEPKYSKDIKNPLKSFHFYAYQKIKKENFWILSFFLCL